MNKYDHLTHEYYTSKEIFEKEVNKIFSNLWIFAGLTSALKKNDSYITRNISQIPIFLQNIKGEINAFINQCPHRMSPIHNCEHGIRKMTCPYHGWSFNKDGNLHAIPNEELYNFSSDDKKQLNLKKINLTTIGKFIFINLNDNPIEINVQFDKYIINSLVEISEYFDEQFAFANFPMETNWKLNTEVIKDPNHIPFVHSKSFAPLLLREKNREMKIKKLTTWENNSNVNLSSLSYMSNAVVVDSLPWYRELIIRHDQNSNHLSWYLYPNTHFASVRGDYFFIQHYDPSSTDKINFNLWVFTSKKKDTSTDFTALLRALMIAERKIIEEDSIILSKIQASLGHWSPTPNHGAYEFQIAQQNKWYRDNIIEAQPFPLK